MFCKLPIAGGSFWMLGLRSDLVWPLAEYDELGEESDAFIIDYVKVEVGV
jgi:hypothetical protein